MKLGIDALTVATTHYQLPLATLAKALDVPVGKYHSGLGQEYMSIPGLDEDCVTMAAEAVEKLQGVLAEEERDLSRVRTVFFATESSVDQSKAAGVFVHSLVGLPQNVRTFEVKEACYGGTAALQMALAAVARNPEEQALVITSDIARYAVDEAGEPTQGAGAVAMLVSANPRLLEIEPISGLYTADINDFWRPNDSSTPSVHGHLSMDAYMDAFTGAWDDYLSRGGREIAEFSRFIHHQPFGKMARKAHARLSEHTGTALGDAMIEAGLEYGKHIGNSYTSALYIGIASMLANDVVDLTGTPLGIFSYGSGAVGEFFAGVPVNGYRDMLKKCGVDTGSMREMLASREELSFEMYRARHAAIRTDSEDFTTPKETPGPFRFAGVKEKARQYERVNA